MPAPSPVFASQPHAPRCWRLISTCEAARDDGVGSAAGDVDDEPDATGVVLERRIVETVALRRFAVLQVHAVVIADLLPLAK